MEITLAIIASIAVVGLIALGVVQLVLATREREQLHRMIKSKDLVEYVSTVDEQDQDVEEPIKEVAIDEIPFLGESEEVN
jgi:hypothetical protein